MNQRWVVIGSLLAVVIGVGSGVASGFFLAALNGITLWQTTTPWLLFLLPLAGAIIAWAYNGFGESAAGGNNLILDQIHDADADPVPLRLFPLVLAATLLTHLCGGSAGREGTAVQMGGAIAGWLSRTLGLDSGRLRILLMCGISGGFASVFGTPLAGAVFGMEVLAIGGIRYDALIPCLVAALSGDLAVRLLGIPHTHYAVQTAIPALGIIPIVLVAIAAVAFGLTSALFSELTLLVEHVAKRAVANPIWRTFVGGALVVAITLLLGTRMYNGLSLPLLSDAFTDTGVPTFAFLIKLVLTAVTLGVGFKGGEVTPLFVIGATLGASLAGPLGLPADFLAALGFIAVFAAAANTPIACVLMGAELFSTTGIVYFGVAAFVAYTVSGHRGIYRSQRVLVSKLVATAPGPLEGLRLRDLPPIQWPRRER